MQQTPLNKRNGYFDQWPFIIERAFSVEKETVYAERKIPEGSTLSAQELALAEAVLVGRMVHNIDRNGNWPFSRRRPITRD